MKKQTLAALAVLSVASAQASLVKLVPDSRLPKGFVLQSDRGVEYTLSFWRPDVFRVQVAPKGADGAVNYSDPLNKPDKAQILVAGYQEDATGVECLDADGKFTFKTSSATIEFDKASERMRVCDWRGRELLSESQCVAFGEKDCVQLLASADGERWYGGGQQVGRLLHNGAKLRIDCDCNWAEGGSPNPAPFVMSSRGVGVMRHTFSAGEYDFTDAKAARLSHSERRFDAFYFCGGDFASVIDRYTEATGRPNLIPMWGLELGDADAYMTRDKDTKLPSQKEDGSFAELTPDVIRRVAMAYRDNDMPCGWLLVNDGYGCGYVQLVSVVDSLRALNFHTGLWTEGVLDRIKWEVGTAGVRVHKLDVAWTSQGGAYKMQHALQCNDDAYTGMIENSDARPFVWTVLGWAGTQRYGICWAGDQYGGWDLIRYMIPTITGSAMSGQAYATTDVDGIFGGSDETYLRDLQWKCWTTAMYVMNGWSHVNKSAWSLPEPYRGYCRNALKHKLRMTPFFYSLMRAAYDSGAPIVRPMVWNYPDDPIACDDATKYQFMVGNDVLVAPVYTSAKVNGGWWRKGIYLPEGDWYDYNDGRRVPGGQTLKASPRDLGKIPVFVRAGAILPMYPECVTTSGSDKKTLTFDIWPSAGTRETFEVYEDDGESRAYARGEFTRQRVFAENAATSFDEQGNMTIVITPVLGSFDGMYNERVYEYLVHTQARPSNVFVKETPGIPMRQIADRKEVLALESKSSLAGVYANSREGWYYDEAEKGGTLHVKLAPRAIDRTVVLEVRMASDSVARAESPAYPVPSAEEEAAAQEAVKVFAADMFTDKSRCDGKDMIAPAGIRLKFGSDGSFNKITGHVATHPDNDPSARFTFSIYADKQLIFQRANMKGSDVPQLIAVDIPGGARSLNFDFTADDETEASKNAKGVWKGVVFSAE